MTFLNALLLWSAVHFLGDFAFQNDWMATKKTPSNYNPAKDCAGPWEVLVYHCATYTATFVIATTIMGNVPNPRAVLTIFTTHYVVDACKARRYLVKTIWLDQTLHLLTLVPLILLGWL